MHMYIHVDVLYMCRQSLESIIHLMLRGHIEDWNVKLPCSGTLLGNRFLSWTKWYNTDTISVRMFRNRDNFLFEWIFANLMQ